MLCCLAALIGNATEVSFDFKTNNYGMTRYSSGDTYNTNPYTITDGAVTLTLNGGKNRLWSDGLRFHANSYMIISVGDANRITSVEATINKDNTFCLSDNTPQDNLLVTASSNKISWTATEAQNYSELRLKRTGTSSGKAIVTLTVTYESNIPVNPDLKDAEVAFAQKEVTFEIGQSVALPEITKATTADVTVTSNDESIVTYDAATNMLNAVAVGTTTVTASALANAEYNAGSATLTVTVTPVMAEYGIASKIEDGKKYLLAFGDKFSTGALMVYSNAVYESDGYGYGEVTELTENNGVVTAPIEYAYTFKAVDNGFTITNKAGASIYMQTRDAFYLTKDQSTTNAIWSVSRQDDGTMKIQNTGTSKYIQYASTYGTYGAYTTEKGVMPTLYVLGGETSDPEAIMPVFTVAENDWANELEGVVYKGAKLTISAPEGTPAGWIMAYKVNDGTEEMAEEAVTIDINANTTVTAYINDEANAVTKTFTVAQIAPLTIDPAFGAVAEGTTVEITTTTPGALLHGFIGETAIEGEAMPYTFTVSAATDVNVWAENPRYLDSEPLEGAYTIMIPSAAPKWEAVTSVDQLQDGDIVTFTAHAYATKNVSIPEVIMNAYNTTSSYIDCSAYEYTDNVFSVTPYSFTLNKSADGKFSFKNAEGKYMTHSGTKNTLNFAETVEYLTLEIGTEGNAIVTADTQGTKTYKLQYYPQNSKGTFDYTTLKFTFYGSDQQDVYMYRQLPAGPSKPTVTVPETADGKLKVGDKLTIECEAGATIAVKEETAAPEAIAPRAADAASDWYNTGENPYEYEIMSLGMRVSFAAVKNGIYSEPAVLTISDSGITTGIEGIEAETAVARAEYYNLQGVRVNNPANGLYIRLQGGKAEKVIIR